MIPKNAEKIIAARIKGFRPAAMVIVSMVEPPQGVAPGLDNPVVIAKPGPAYDWRWVRDLDVCLYVTDEDDWGSTAKDIAMQGPAYLGIWNHAGKWGARIWLVPTADDVSKPKRQWRFDIDFSIWMDFQNKDFIERRRYERDENGLPYAI